MEEKSGCRLVAMALVLGTSYREFESRHPDHSSRPILITGLWLARSTKSK